MVVHGHGKNFLGLVLPDVYKRQALDMKLREVLISGTKRQYTFIARQNLPPDLTTFHSSEQPQALRCV